MSDGQVKLFMNFLGLLLLYFMTGCDVSRIIKGPNEHVIGRNK